ncbi:MAG: pyruvate:ferredoxin (flavodoxin) oxidoreductase [Saprospiraceae bacterium]|nr:pyruvate:ferredoxin (flavodoxin) oxidoreductase [Saprospiraceae bacterium]
MKELKNNLPLVATLDGNEACAYIAYRVNEVCAIYPITPSSTMAEFADEWSAKGIKNIWGNVPEIIEMQSEGGAAGTVHGSLQSGALTTTFTASQGLMLMLPNMYKIAGELTSAVIHVAARSLAAQALSIFGDHQDIMAARTTGFAIIGSTNVQEAHDMALIAQAATLKSRLPFIHFFDGFRTSHEVNKIELIADDVITQMINEDLVIAHRQRALNPNKPFIRGTAQNPDVYFQGREASNTFYNNCPGLVEEAMDQFGELTGRWYKPFEYYGHAEPDRIIVIMGSGFETVQTAVSNLNRKGEKVGVVLVRLFRPFSAEHLLEILPSSAYSIAVLDRTKECGATGEPLYTDIVSAFMKAFSNGDIESLPKIIGGRYGLSSKEFTPAMVNAVFANLAKPTPKNPFTIGIFDDVTHLSLDFNANEHCDDPQWTQAMFYGLGADGTVGANKNSIKIIGENTSLYAQGYFVYDSKKSGARTVSHLRFGPNTIKAPYLIHTAGFIACHQFGFLEKVDVLGNAAKGAIFLLNSVYDKDEVWENLPFDIQKKIVDLNMRFFVIDANKVAQITGMAGRINTIMQTCFFAISGVLPREEAIAQIKKSIEKTYYKKGKAIIEKNFQAVDMTLENLFEVGTVGQTLSDPVIKTNDYLKKAPSFVTNVLWKMMEGNGDSLPVSVMPNDGTYPSGTTKWEKRRISEQVAKWNPSICIQCGNCSFVCPHAVIRSKFFHESTLDGAPVGFNSAPINAKGFPETRYSLQVYLEDCTGCNLCNEVCPVTDPADRSKKAINIEEIPVDLTESLASMAFFEAIPWNEKSEVNFSLVHGAQFLEPLFEFSGACAGCGETPYIKLLTQLFGDRLMVANATGCSSIYGGNLPTTPWAVNALGQGPAWSNSLFEDNAEFGLGMRIAADVQRDHAFELLKSMNGDLGESFVYSIVEASQNTESEIVEQRRRVARLKELLAISKHPDAGKMLSLSDHLIKRSVWLIGGDGWAYDIGAGGLDHALASGKNINVLVLDTEVYSNTGGQMSKATPTAATAKFASAGKRVGKKDLALQAISYGNVYVAQIAMGANPQQTLLAMREAEAYPGPSLILAYSHCIAHGIDMSKGLEQQSKAVASAYWPLLRYNPILRRNGKNPFVLDSPRPTMSLKDYAYQELRYKVLTLTNAEEAEKLMDLAQEIVDLRWKTYESMAIAKADTFQPVY